MVLVPEIVLTPQMMRRFSALLSRKNKKASVYI